MAKKKKKGQKIYVMFCLWEFRYYEICIAETLASCFIARIKASSMVVISIIDSTTPRKQWENEQLSKTIKLSN